MPVTDYIPAKDADFALWLANFNAKIALSPTSYGLVTGDSVIIAGVNTTFQAAFVVTENPATRTSPTIAAKDAARAVAENTVRPYAVRVSRSTTVSDLLKVGLGVTVPKLVPTPIPPPVDVPAIALESALPLVTRLSYKVTGAVNKAKPFGAIGIEVFRSVGVTPAVDPNQTDYKGTVTKSPFVQNFLPADQGKICTIFARFVNRSGTAGVAATGPWSSPLTFTVI